MKRVYLCGLIAGLMASPAARADVYAGFDGNHYSPDMKISASPLYPQSAGGMDLHIGDRIGRFAGEIGYGNSTKSSDGVFDNLRLNRLTLDGFFYVPVFGGFNLLLTGGMADTNYGISIPQKNYFEDAKGQQRFNTADIPVAGGNEFDWRAGGGFSFGFDAYELRVLAHYQPLSMGGLADNALSIDVGLNIYF